MYTQPALCLQMWLGLSFISVFHKPQGTKSKLLGATFKVLHHLPSDHLSSGTSHPILTPPMTHTSNTKLPDCQNSPAVSDFSAYNPPGTTSSLRAQLKGHLYWEASSSPSSVLSHNPSVLGICFHNQICF